MTTILLCHKYSQLADNAKQNTFVRNAVAMLINQHISLTFYAILQLKPQGQYWIEYLSTTNNSNYQYGRC